jgi:ribosome-binding protein aMBF1 (putative translation factor)
MLPHPHSVEFPAALKSAREAHGMSRAQLAKAAGIHEVMPRRYEEPTCSEFTRPTIPTWAELNRALGFEIVSESSNTVEPPAEEKSLPLSKLSIDDLVGELRKRGIGVTLTFPT